MRWRRLLLSLALPLAAALAASAQTSAPTSTSTSTSTSTPMPMRIAQLLPDARLAGQGEFTWFTLKIYSAQLWVGARGYRGDAPDAAPFVLDLRYARALNGRKIADASAEQMQKIGAGSEAQRDAWRQTMRGIFPDVKEGQHISGAYLPGVGALLSRRPPARRGGRCGVRAGLLRHLAGPGQHR